MGESTAFRYCHFAAGNAFQHAETTLLQFIGLHIDKVGTGQTVLSDQDRLLVAFKFRQQFRRLAFEGSDKFGSN